MAKTTSWSKLMDGYGPATSTPAFIADLSAKSATKRKQARDELYDRFATDAPVTGLPEVVKALVPLALDESTVETRANVRARQDEAPAHGQRPDWRAAERVGTHGQSRRCRGLSTLRAA